MGKDVPNSLIVANLKYVFVMLICSFLVDLACFNSIAFNVTYAMVHEGYNFYYNRVSIFIALSRIDQLQ